MSLKESRKMKKDNLFPFPIQEIAKGGPTAEGSPSGSGEDLTGAKASLESQVRVAFLEETEWARL